LAEAKWQGESAYLLAGKEKERERKRRREREREGGRESEEGGRGGRD
jgi:hypothetical protein